MFKKNYRKIGKKKDNDVDVDVTQRDHSNIKRYTSAFSNIQIITNREPMHCAG